MSAAGEQAHKKHVKSGKKGRAANDKVVKEKGNDPRAFGFHSAVRALRQSQLKEDRQTSKHHAPVADRTPAIPPPVTVAVVGPPMVGKTTLIR